jgi:Ca-activated chloride channel family protein
MLGRVSRIGVGALVGLCLSCSTSQETQPEAKQEAKEVRADETRGFGSENLAPSSLRYRMASEPYSTDSFGAKDENDFRRATDDPLSTFSIDVDTASYSIVRRMIREGQRPPVGAVRIEELVNYFPYDYPEPSDGRPFSVTTEVAAAPWAPAPAGADRAQGQVDRGARPRRLAGVPDRRVGPMMTPTAAAPGPVDETLVDQLERKDRVSVVVYAGNTEPGAAADLGDRRGEIREALDRLSADGRRTAAPESSRLRDRAQELHLWRQQPGHPRTDGDFNVGVSNQSELVERIEQHAKERSSFRCSASPGNLKDDTMEKLADRGNGNYAYIDSLAEARKVLVQQAGGTLVTVAKDVKIQVEGTPPRRTA